MTRLAYTTRGPIGVVVLAGGVLLACTRAYYTPEVAGVVLSRTPTDAGWHYVVETGHDLTIDLTEGKRIVYGTVSPDVGDLLLSGTGPEGPWIARLTPPTWDNAPAGCYTLESSGTDRGDWIETDVGIRLPKAPGFLPLNRRDGDRYAASIGHVFCVNEDGQAAAFL